MTKVYVTGRNKSMCKREAEYAVNFFTELLLGRRLSKNITVVLSFKKNSLDEGACFPVDETPSKKPRTFDIEIASNMSRNKQLEALAHEMVHVKQFARGELGHIYYDAARWMGKRVRLQGDSLVEYFNWPWEIEAFGRERGLLLLYKEHVKSERLKFKKK